MRPISVDFRPTLRPAFALLAVMLAGCGRRDVPVPDLPAVAPGERSALVQRGEYVVRSVAVCGHCHAARPPGDPDGVLSGGRAFSNWRLGTIRASNLTPDSATGLGAWTEAEIVRALRTGVDREGRLLAPVMPYDWLYGMSDEDALAVALYLKSLEPVRHEVRNSPNLVFRAARGLFLRPARPMRGSAPPRAPTPEYGSYLANHVAFCADCHTPRTGLMQTHDRRRPFAGDASPPAGFPANPSNLTPHPELGIGSWSESDFLRAIRSGVTPAGDTLHRFMPWPQLRRMQEDDLRAIYRYLRELEPIANRVPRRVEGQD